MVSCLLIFTGDLFIEGIILYTFIFDYETYSSKILKIQVILYENIDDEVDEILYQAKRNNQILNVTVFSDSNLNDH